MSKIHSEDWQFYLEQRFYVFENMGLSSQVMDISRKFAESVVFGVSSGIGCHIQSNAII